MHVRTLAKWAVRTTAVCAVAAAVIGPPAAHADVIEMLRAATTVPVASPAAEAPSGLMVAIDPVTGALRAPSAAQARALAAQMAAAMPPSLGLRNRVQVYGDGSMSMMLGVDNLDFAVVTVGDDGRLHQGCVHGPLAAVSAAPALEEE